MKRLALWTAIVTLPACCTVARGPSQAQSQQTTLVQRLEQETVALVHYVNSDGAEVKPDSKDAKRLAAYCTGVWVSDDQFLTAEHCVDDIGKPTPEEDLGSLLQQLENQSGIKLWTPINQPVMFSTRDDITTSKMTYRAGTVSAVDMYNDMVLVKTKAPVDHITAELAQGPILDGQDVHVVGHTVGMWWSYMHGYVSAHRPTFIDSRGHPHDMLQISAPIFFGDSGGGAFDAEGKLIGMTDEVKGYDKVLVPNVGIFVHRDVIRGFLEHNRVLPQRSGH